MRAAIRSSALLGFAVAWGAVWFAVTPTDAAAADGANLWSLKMIEMPGDWEAIRVNTSTGQAWAARSGKWVAITEQGDQPGGGDVGTYECHTTYGSKSDTWYALRFNVKTGQCWSLDAREWKLITD